MVPRSISLLIAWAACLAPACESASTCESRCMREERCMQALAADGTAPPGSTRDDQTTCTRICTALRTRERSANQELGEVREKLGHPCLR